MAVSRAVPAEDFQLVNPHGGMLSKDQYRDGIASGAIDYRQFEPVSEIRLLIADELAVIRYQSRIDIEVQGQPELLRCWHADCRGAARMAGRSSGRRQRRSNQVRPIPPHDLLRGAQNNPIGVRRSTGRGDNGE